MENNKDLNKEEIKNNLETNVEKHAITKGGFYQALSGNTKGVTIFILIMVLAFIGFMIYIAIRLG